LGFRFIALKKHQGVASTPVSKKYLHREHDDA